MVEVLRDPQRKYVADMSAANKAAKFADTFSGMSNTGLGAAKIAKNVYDIRKGEADQQKEVEYKIKSANAKTIQDFQDANDSILAANNADKLETDLLRYNEQMKLDRPDYVGTREYEEDLRNKAAEYNTKYSTGLGNKGMNDYTKSSNSKVNQIVQSNVRWSFAKKAKDAEDSAKDVANKYAVDSKYFGENLDLEGFATNRTNNREALSKYIERVSPAYKGAALYEADKKAAMGFLSGIAETNPELARQYLESDENLKKVLGEDMLDNVGSIYDSAKLRQIETQRATLQSQLESTTDRKVQRDIEKKLKKLDDEAGNINEEERESESLAAIRREITPDIERAIKHGETTRDLREKQDATKNQVDTFKTFLNTPNYETIKKTPTDKGELRNAMENYYHSTADVPQNLTPDLDTALPTIAKSCQDLLNTNITPDGDMSPVLTKAYNCMTDLGKSGLTQREMQSMREYVQKMTTEPYFKEGTERIISGSMTNKWYPDDTQKIMQKQAKQAQYNAFFGAMNILSQGAENPNEAIKSATDYMYNARQATFAKLAGDKYGIDVDKMQKELDKGKDAFVDLGNGNMSYFRGFDANGNILVEPAMTKVKDDRF